MIPLPWSAPKSAPAYSGVAVVGLIILIVGGLWAVFDAENETVSTAWETSNDRQLPTEDDAGHRSRGPTPIWVAVAIAGLVMLGCVLAALG